MQITARHKEQVFCLNGSQTGGWVTQTTCEISILEDIQNVIGKDPEQPDISSKLPPVRSLMTSIRPFILALFCSSMILTSKLNFEFQQISPFSSH